MPIHSGPLQGRVGKEDENIHKYLSIISDIICPQSHLSASPAISVTHHEAFSSALRSKRGQLVVKANPT